MNRTDAQAKGEPAHVIVGTFWPVTLALLPLVVIVLAIVALVLHFVRRPSRQKEST